MLKLDTSLLRRTLIGIFFISLIAIVPAAHGWTGLAIPFGNNGHCDPWYYYGLMHFPDYGNVLVPGARTISRIPAYLPTYLLANIPFGLTFQEVSFWINHTIFSIALAAALVALFNLQIAVMTTLLVTTSALYLAIESTTYPTSAALAYAAIALACVAWSTQSPQWLVPLAFAGGAAAAFAVHGHLASVVFIFFLPIIFANSGVRNVSLGSALAALLLGGLAGTGLVGVAGIALGQGFFSFMYQINEAIKGVGYWWYEGWMGRSVGLALSLMLPLLEAMVFLVRKSERRRSAVILISISAVSTFNVFTTMAFKEQFLVYEYFYAMMLPLAALVIADATDLCMPRLRTLYLALLIIGLISLHLFWIMQFRTIMLAHFMLLSISAGLITAALITGTKFLRRQSVFYGTATIIAIFGMLQSAIGDQFRGHLTLNREAEIRLYQRADAALQLLRQYGINQRPVAWLGHTNDAALQVAVFRSLIRCNFEQGFPNALPDPVLHWQAPLAPGQLLVWVGPKEGGEARLVQAMTKFHMQVTDMQSIVLGDLQLIIGRVQSLQ
jgi:hypothetical protein